MIYFEYYKYKGGNPLKKEIIIDGMSCGHCVNHVKETLSGLSGISKVEVNLEEQRAIVEGDNSIQDDAIKVAIDDAGYEVVSIKEL